MIAAAAPSTNPRKRGAPSPGPSITCSMGGAPQMPDSSQANDVASYASAVRAALAPLPDAERESLLEDLENHLAEVASESDLSLQERLGPPEDYAAELRSAYGSGNETSSGRHRPVRERDRKSTRLNSSHGYISYAGFCLKKKNRKSPASQRSRTGRDPGRPGSCVS